MDQRHAGGNCVKKRILMPMTTTLVNTLTIWVIPHLKQSNRSRPYAKPSR